MDFNYLISVLGVAIFVGAAAFFAISLAFSVQKRRIMRALRSYFEAPDQESPSQFGLLVEVIAQLFAQKLVSNLKNVIGGMNSADAKNAERAELSAIKQANPVLGNLDNLLPKRWKKNADLIKLAAAFLGNPGDNNKGQSPPLQSNLFRL